MDLGESTGGGPELLRHVLGPETLMWVGGFQFCQKADIGLPKKIPVSLSGG